VLLDTGQRVAALDSRDKWHRACVKIWPDLITRCVTTEAVVTEACHLVGRGRHSSSLPLEFLLRGEIPILSLPVGGQERAVDLMKRYAAVPMDYADATLVAAAEALGISEVFTLDRRGFAAYRRPRGARFTILPAG